MSAINPPRSRVKDIHGRKVSVSTYDHIIRTLVKEQVSRPGHYDFGSLSFDVEDDLSITFLAYSRKGGGNV